MNPATSDPSPAQERVGSQERSVNDGQQLFGTLLASRPPRQRRMGPIIIAALLHIPLIAVLWITQGERIMSTLRIDPVTILLVDDNPPPIEHPAETREEEEKEEKEEERPEPAPSPPASAGDEEAAPAPIRAPTSVPGNPVPGFPDPANPIVPPPAEPGGGGSGRPNSVYNRLSRPADPRVFGPPGDAPAPTAPEEARARLATRIREINDSIAMEAEAQRRATDWTVKGEDGKRWGISPGKIHLGDITIPLGDSKFAPPAWQRDEINRRVRDWAEIETQATRLDNKDSFGERVKEIRKRKERERAEKKKVTASGS